MTPMRALRVIAAAVLAAAVGCDAPRQPQPYEIRFDATRPRAELAPEGERLFERKKCANCHLTRGTLAIAGPNLHDVGAQRGARDLEVWVRDPRRMKPNSRMPPFDGTEDQLEAIIAYLLTLK